MLEHKFVRTRLCFLLMVYTLFYTWFYTWCTFMVLPLVSSYGSVRCSSHISYYGSTHVHGSTRCLSHGFYP